jgi:hypothetical protein
MRIHFERDTSFLDLSQLWRLIRVQQFNSHTLKLNHNTYDDEVAMQSREEPSQVVNDVAAVALNIVIF